jgi:hypothetical protein
VALREEFGSEHQVSLIIRKLNDETMLKIMARENMEEWDTNAEIVRETLRATVEAYAEGRIELEHPKKDTPHAYILYAPSFIPGRGGGVATTSDRPYTVQALAEFLGWVDRAGPRPDMTASDNRTVRTLDPLAERVHIACCAMMITAPMAVTMTSVPVSAALPPLCLVNLGGWRAQIGSSVASAK